MENFYSRLYQNQLRKSFSYLENQYGYIYDVKEFCYSKAAVKVYVFFEPHNVLIEIWLTSEPRYTRVPITLLLEVLDEKSYPNINETKTVEETIEICALFYSSRIDRIANTLQDILVPALKKSILKGLEITQWPLVELLKAGDYGLIFDYIQSKDLTWTVSDQS